jgi:hypothetical protein
MPRVDRRTVAFLVALLIAVPVARLHADSCKSGDGAFTSTLVPPPDCPSPIGLCTIGALDGQHDQTYFFVMETFVPDADVPGRFNYTGHSEITTVNGGATLAGQDSGYMFIGADQTNVPFVTTVNIVDGTRQFADATGQYVATGVLNFISGDAVGTFTSNVCHK